MAVHDFNAQRLFVEQPLHAAARVVLSREQANYLVNVLRLSAGDRLRVFDGSSGEWEAELEPVGRRDAALWVRDKLREQTAGPDIHYLFAPLKRARLDYMVQKATELGVAHLQPVITRHTVAERVNTDRMRANVIEAAEQCGVLRVPTIAEPARLDAVIAGWDDARILIVADESAPPSSPIGALAPIGVGKPVALLIGPEGGFADNERDLLATKPFVRKISLGPRIMRADTAAVAALALIASTIGDWGPPEA
jgi:16S rRNA (uracil1498-N3)-methyltransferase